MSAVEWTDAERRCCFGTCGGDVSQHAPHQDWGCLLFEDVLSHLAPHVAAREAQAAAKALREAALAVERSERSCSVRRSCHQADAITLRERADRIEREGKQ